MYIRKLIFILVIVLFSFYSINSYSLDKLDSIFKSNYGGVHLGYGYNRDSTNMKFINFGLSIIHPIENFADLFFEVSTNFGIDGAQKCYNLSLTPGFRISLCNEHEFWMNIDIGVGVGSIYTKATSDRNSGLNGLDRVGIGYKNFTIEISNQIFISKEVSYNIFGVNLRYSFPLVFTKKQ